MALVLRGLSHDEPEALANRLEALDRAGEGASRHPLSVISRVILCRRIREIMRCLFPVSDGLAGVLRKLGDVPLPRTDYDVLISLHTQPEHRSRAVLLRHIPNLPRRAIPTLLALEPPYVLPAVLDRVGSVEQALDFARSVELIKRVVPNVSDERLVASLNRLKPGATLGQWIKRWLSRATTFWIEPPLQDNMKIVCLGSAAALNDAARRFRNCLSGKVTACALGRTLFLEYLPTPVVIELTVLDRGFLLEAMYGPENATPEPKTRAAIVRQLTAAGIFVQSRDAQACRYNRVARLASIYDFARDDLDLFENDVFETESGMDDAA